MTTSPVQWTKIGTGRWEAVVGGKQLTVTRVIRQRCHSSTAIVSAVVRIGDEWHRLMRPSGIYTVRDAKAAAIRYALTGDGEATITRVDD